MSTAADRLVGCILGTAVGDALGLPREGLARGRAQRLFGGAPLRHAFLFGRGMISDDTEHACMTGQALLASGGGPDSFARALAGSLRGWLLGLPAGIGLATLRAVLKLCTGVPPARSGVPSAGNGPAMRAPVLGAYAACHEISLDALVRTSTRITHTDPRAETGALLIARAAHDGVRLGPPEDPAGWLAAQVPTVADAQLRGFLETAITCLDNTAPLDVYADAIGLTQGVTGFINHTVPVALYAWLRTPNDFRAALESVILLGGDADTTGAIVGGLMGATLGAGAISADWLHGLTEAPYSVAWMRRLGEALAAEPPGRALPVAWPIIPPRNLLFTITVLLHGLRRLLPPY